LETVHGWGAANGQLGWASCPLTENGLVRIMSNPDYNRQVRFTPGDLIGRFRQFTGLSDHEFWPDDLSLCDEANFITEHLLSSRLLTDLYLLGLAAKNDGRLVTFDQGIPLNAVRQIRAGHLCVV
jgi:hypothetical protein